MRPLKMSLMLLLITLSSCKWKITSPPPTIRNEERCVIAFTKITPSTQITPINEENVPAEEETELQTLADDSSNELNKELDIERSFNIVEELPERAEGYCRCHEYQFSIKGIGRVGESVDHPLSYCNKLVGFRPSVWERFYNDLEEMRVWFVQQVNANKKK